MDIRIPPFLVSLVPINNLPVLGARVPENNPANKKKVYLGGNNDFLSTTTGKMYQNYMIETAGAINVASEIDDTYWATISYEQILNYNPDLKLPRLKAWGS